MPAVGSSRVQNTGRGEITYSNNTSNSTTNSTTASATTSNSSSSSALTIDGVNIGTGYGVFAGATGTDNVLLDFKTIRAGNGITMADDGFTITINSTGGGGYISNGSGGNGTTIGSGFQLALGNALSAGDGLWSGAVPLTDNTAVSDAVYKLNKIMSLLVPSSPPAFPNGTLSLTNTSGNSPLLAAGVADHASSGLVAGAAVSRTIAPANSNILSNVGPGNSGTIQLLLNNNVVSSHTMTGVGDNGTYGALAISAQGAYPTGQPGFWTSFSVGISGQPVALGINKLSLNDTAAGSTNQVVFVYDDVVSTPNLVSPSLAQASAGTYNYSSGVPHYGTGGTLLLGASITNLSGQTYYGGNDPLMVQGTSSITSPQIYNYSNLGITTPIHAETTASTPVTPFILNIDGVTHGKGLIAGTVKNVNGAGSATNFSNTIILVKNGLVPSNKIDENNVPVSGLGSIPNNNNAMRVLISQGVDQPTTAPTAWDSTQLLPAYEASVVAGLLSNDTSNYSIGFLPVGPNYSSGRNAAQYVTFSFNRSAVSTFNINVAGNYAGCWIKLPGVSDNSTISPHSVNGWWNAGVAYNGAGVPGNPSDTSAGCSVGQIMGGSAGSYTITFGPQTSSNSTGNQILVRFRLNTAQSISSLSFSI